MKQTTFSSLAWNGRKKTTRREAFLAEMDPVIPWERFTKLIEPVYPKEKARDPQMHQTRKGKQGHFGYRVNRRRSEHRPLTDHQRYVNRARSRCRTRGEHAFHMVKRLWGYSKVRYRGLAKNTARLFTAFALANLYLLRRRLNPA